MQPTKFEHLPVMEAAEGGHEPATQSNSARFANSRNERNVCGAVGE